MRLPAVSASMTEVFSWLAEDTVKRGGKQPQENVITFNSEKQSRP